MISNFAPKLMKSDKDDKKQNFDSAKPLNTCPGVEMSSFVVKQF